MFTGHGTPNPDDILNQGMTVWQQDAADAVAYVKEKGYEEVAVLGLSMGGILAMDRLTQDPTLMGGGLFAHRYLKPRTKYQSILKSMLKWSYPTLI